MIHARADYDSIQPWPTKRPHYAKVAGVTITFGPEHQGDDVDPIIPDDEPVFLIRGQDLAAIPAAEAWCEAAAHLGADQEIIDAVRRHIDVVRRWQREHAAKVPDAPAGVLR